MQSIQAQACIIKVTDIVGEVPERREKRIQRETEENERTKETVLANET
jgi:hypothetical protein